MKVIFLGVVDVIRTMWKEDLWFELIFNCED